MQKPLTYYRQGFAIKKLKSILAQIIPIHQYILLVQDNRLSEALEAIESFGFTGDVALFLLACCQEVANA
jgi:hypothetical protein